MAQEDEVVVLLQKAGGHAAKDPFAKTTVAIGAGDDEVGAKPLGRRENSVLGRHSPAFHPGFGLHPMATQSLGDISHLEFGPILLLGLADAQHQNGLRLQQERQA